MASKERKPKVLRANGSLNAGTFNSSPSPNQHDCDRGHVRIGPAVLVRS